MTLLGTEPTNPSTIRSGTGRPVHKFENLGTVPTNPSTIRSETGRLAHQFGSLGIVPTTERYMLGDWSTSLIHCRRS